MWPGGAVEYSLYTNRHRLSRINFSINYLRLGLLTGPFKSLTAVVTQNWYSFINVAGYPSRTAAGAEQNFFGRLLKQFLCYLFKHLTHSQALQDTGETGKKCICVTVEIQNIVKPWKYTFYFIIENAMGQRNKKSKKHIHRTLSLRFSHWFFLTHSEICLVL